MQEFLAHLFANGGIVNVIFAFMLIEGLGLIVFHRFTGCGLPIAKILFLMFPGLFLLLALKGALSAAAWPVIAGWLLAALIAHLVDVWLRLSREIGASSRR